MIEAQRNTLALVAGAMALACPLAAHAQEEGPPAATSIKVSAGVNYSEGHYGRSARTRVLTAPITVRVTRGRFSLRISVPFVSIDGPGTLLDGARSSTSGSTGATSGGDVSGSDDAASGSGDAISDDNGAIDDNGGSSGGSDDGGSGGGGSGGSDDGSGSGGSGGGSGSGGGDDGGSSGSGSGSGSGGSGGSGSDDPGGPPRIEPTYPAPPLAAAPAPASSGQRSGLGDITVTLAYAADPLPWLTLQASGRVKLPTASRSRGIGTGKVDTTLAAEAIARFGAASVHAGARRRFLGRPVGWTIRDGWGVGAGASYALGKGVSFGVDYDWLQSATPGRAPLSEATGWISLPLDQRLRLQAYAGTGFSSRSSALLAGLSVSLRM
ncbi:hypothetical protein [Novosphingobium percolationis]|uniref:hypothetical protein n=1 Tax=Novosphingobium percolationis TaxID=2871811 RepID=UPI001CD71458|nr:hypothetical protein [Novosphingobium percolationis]